MLEKEGPLFLVGTPMCTAFSQWQTIHKSRRPEKENNEVKARARIHLRFTMHLYAMQIKAGHYILHEHPAYSTSWDEDCRRRIMSMEGVNTVIAHQCQHGTRDEKTGYPVKKPTRYMSNAPRILMLLEKLCRGRREECSAGGRHQQCLNRVAKGAATFSARLCKKILQGMNEQLVMDGEKDMNEVGFTGYWDENGLNTVQHNDSAVDDVTGQPLDRALVRIARQQ